MNTPEHRNIGKSANKVDIKSVQPKRKIMWVNNFSQNSPILHFMKCNSAVTKFLYDHRDRF